jgi:hypothetical protein
MENIKSVFDHHCATLEITPKFAKEIIEFDQRFVTKNSDHVNFFGSPYLGVYPIRWTDEERNRWVDDLLAVDEIALKDDIRQLPTIDPTHTVATDFINLSFVYILFRFHNSGLESNLKHMAMMSVVRIMHYKFLTSLMAHYFRYPADEAIAKATYTALSLKFDIKRLGSWGALITDRADIINTKNSLHWLSFTTMRDDHAVQRMISDVQSRIREVVKAQVAVFYKVRENGDRVLSTSSIITTDEGFTVRDVKRTISNYLNYMNSILPQSRDFVREDLLNIIGKLNPSANPVIVKNALAYMSDNYLELKKPYVKKVVEDTIIYSFNFIRNNRIEKSDLPNIAVRLRSMFTGSRVNDPAILELRQFGDQIVIESQVRRTGVPISPERTAMLLYIVMRAMTKNHYQR